MADDPKLKIRIETTADLKAAEEASRAIEKIDESAQKAAPSIDGVTDAAEKSTEQLEQTGATAEETADQLEAVTEAADETAPAIEEVTDAAEQSAEQLEQAGATAEDTAGKLSSVADAASKVAPALEEADEEVKAIEEDMRRLIDAARGVQPAIESVKNSASDLGTSTGAAATKGDELVDLFNELRQSGGPAIQILRGAVAATRGGPQAFFGTAQGLRGLLTLLKSAGPQGAAAAAAFATITAAVTALHVAAGQSRKSVEDYAKDIDDASDATEKLNQSKTTSLIAELKALEVQAAATNASLQAVQVQQQAVIDASAQVEVARIAADPTLTPEQRTTRTQAVQQSARASREALTQQVGQTQISAAQQAASDASLREKDFVRREEVARSERDRVKTTPDTITAQIEELQRLQGEALKQAALGTGIVAGTSAGEAGRLEREIDKLRTQRAVAEADREANLKRAEDALAEATQQLTEARAEATARALAAKDVAITVQGDRSAREITEGGTQKAEAIEAAASARREAEQTDPRLAGARAVRERDTAAATAPIDLQIGALTAELAKQPDPASELKIKRQLEALEKAKADKLKQIEADFRKAADAILAAPSESPTSGGTITRRGQEPIVIPPGGTPPPDAAPGAAPVASPSAPVAPVAPAAAPASPAQPEIKVDSEALQPTADAVKALTVPEIPADQVVSAVDQTNRRLQAEVGTFATKTVNAIGDIHIVLSSQNRELARISAFLKNLA